MARIKVKQIDGICKKPIPDAFSAFMRHCQLKNLSPYSYLYYDRNLKFFFESFPKLKYVEEINKGVIEEFIGQLMDRGNRVTSANHPGILTPTTTSSIRIVRGFTWLFRIFNLDSTLLQIARCSVV